MRKGGLWKKTVSILLASAMVLTAVPVSASGFEAEEVQQTEGTMEEVPLEEESQDVLPEGGGSDFQAEESRKENRDFQAEEPESAQGFSAVEDVLKETATPVEVNSVAELQNALTDANGKTIKLMSDIAYGELTSNKDKVQAVVEIPAGSTVVLDLNGHILSASLITNGDNYAKAHVVWNAGKLTIADSSENKTGRIINTNTNSHACTRTVKNMENAQLILNAGTITAASGVGLLNLGDCTADGGKVKIEATQADYTGGWNNACAAIENRADGQLTIRDGVFESISESAIFTDGGKVTIDGGTIIGSAGFGAMNGYPEDYITVTGGTFSSDPSICVDFTAYIVDEMDGLYTVSKAQDPTEVEIRSFSELKNALVTVDLLHPKKLKLCNDIKITGKLTIPSTYVINVEQGNTLIVDKNALLDLKGLMVNDGTLTVKGFVTNPSHISGNLATDIPAVAAGTYTIARPMDLQWLAVLLGEEGQSGIRKILLADDISLPSDAVFQCLGAADSITFDGQEHSITGLTVQTIGGYGGVFEWLGNSTVKDLSLENCNYQTVNGYLGGIAGEVSDCIFENVSISGNIEATGASYGVAGIAAGVYNQGPGFKTEFVNCVSSAQVGGATAYNVGSIFGTCSGSPGFIGIYNCANYGGIVAQGSMGYVFGFGYPNKDATIQIIGFHNEGTVNEKAGSISDAAGTGFNYDIDFSGPEYMAVKQGDGTWKAVQYVASIGDQLYFSIADAITASTSKTMIRLIKDCEEDVTIPAGKDITLDLNGHKLTNVTDHTILNQGTLFIIDNGDGSGTVDNISNGKSAIYNEAGGTVTLSQGIYSRSNETTADKSNTGPTIVNQGTMTIEECEVMHKSSNEPGKHSSLIVNGLDSASWDRVSKETETAELIIRGGSYVGGLHNVENAIGGSLLIYGGEFTQAAQSAVLNLEKATIYNGEFGTNTDVIDNAVVEIESKIYADGTWAWGKLTIAGGEFTANAEQEVLGVRGGGNPGASIGVTGGTFSKDVEAYVLPGYKQVGAAEPYVVQKTEHEVNFQVVGVAIEGPEPVMVGHNKTVAKPYFSPAGYKILGWYKNKECSSDQQWDFAGDKITNSIYIYVKVKSASEEETKEAVDKAISQFDEYCQTISDESNPLKGKKLANITAEVLADQAFITALNDESVKQTVKAIIDELDQSAPAKDLENYLKANPEQKLQIDNLRAIQELLFAVKVQPVVVQNAVEPDKVTEPAPPENIPEDKQDAIKTEINNKIGTSVADTIRDLKNNKEVANKPAAGLEESAKGTVTEPSVLYIEAVLENIGFDAVAEKLEGADAYRVSLVPNKCEFEVTPYKQKALADGTGELKADPVAAPVKIPNDQLKNPVEFYLPVPSTVTAEYARVYHETEKMGTYRIQGKAPNRWVSIVTYRFSKFVLEFTNDSGYVPPSVSYYNVTFDSQGGSAVPAINNVNAYSTIEKPADPTRENFVFGGWYKDAACTQAWDFAKDTVIGNLTLYAKWTEEETPASGLDPVVVKVESRTTSSVKISWSESAKAEGYTIWAREEDQTGYKRVAIISKDDARTYTWKKREPGTKHFFVVKAWIKDENGKYVFSEASKTVRGTTKPEAAKIKKVTVNAAGDMKVTLVSPAKGANRYAMCWSRKADFSRYAIGIRTQYTTRTMAKGLKPGTYYVKVRSYRQMGESRVYGDWSEMVKVTF